MKKKIRKAVFPVAGRGTRFLPATKVIPKEMLPVVDRPLIDYAFEEAIDAGIETFIFVISQEKSVIIDYFNKSTELETFLKNNGKKDIINTIRKSLPKSGSIMSVKQSEQLGLGHAVLCAEELIGDEPFAVILPDELLISDISCLKSMVASYFSTCGNLIATMKVPINETNKYGILDIENINNDLIKVKRMIEKPKVGQAPSCFANIGRYILDPSIFSYLKQQEPSVEGEIQLTDAINAFESSVPFYAKVFKGLRFDCGSKIGFLEANLALALERPDLSDKIRSSMLKFLE